MRSIFNPDLIEFIQHPDLVKNALPPSRQKTLRNCPPESLPAEGGRSKTKKQSFQNLMANIFCKN
jgi:hypothetical protein